MSPTARDALTGEPESQMELFAVGVQDVLDDFGVATAADAGDDVGTTTRFLIVVAVAKLEEGEVGSSVRDVAGYALETPEEEGLTQHVEVLTQGIEQAHAVLCLQALEAVVVGTALERVVEYLMETCTHQLFANDVLQFVALIHVALHDSTTVDGSGHLYVVVSVDTQDVLHHVAGTLYVDTIGGNLQLHAVGRLLQHLHLEALYNAQHRLLGDVLANEVVDIVELEVDDGILKYL